MGEHSDFISSDVILPSQIGEMVSIFVHYDHPLLELKRVLDWEQLEAVMVEHWKKAGKNVAGGRGLSFPVSFYVRLLVLMSVRCLNSREMEQYIAESVVARLFLEVREPYRFQLKDHSSIARAQASLGEEGYKKVNQLIVKEAVRLGFAKPETLSSDTTVQEPLIGYPHEAGILRAVAQRVARVASKLKQAGVEGAAELSGKVKEVMRAAKHYYLFAKAGEEKTEALGEIVSYSAELLAKSGELIESGLEQTSRVVKSGIQKLKELGEFTKELLPQIKGWLATGVVATEKLLHAGITEARSIVKNKVGKKTEFGLKWLINRIGGGYVFGEVVEARANERKMPIKALDQYQEVFGQETIPEMLVYDRGGSCRTTERKLKKRGVEKVAIQPKGQAAWSVVEEDQEAAISQRGKTEGVIGALKSKRYEFKGGPQRTNESLKAAGQRALLGMNLTNLLRDLVSH
jgi:hypothetical protein